MALELIRTITPAVGTLPADADWAGALASPGFAAWLSPNNHTRALLVVKGFDDPVAGVEIGLGGMVYTYASVVGMPLDDGSKKLAQLLSVAVNGRDLLLEVDVPHYAIDFYPRITVGGVGVPAALERLEFWAEGALP